jgi:hypothetical protein
MPTPWIQSVRNSHRLSVFATRAVTQGPWNSVFVAALQEFNRLSTTMDLKVTFVTSSLPPDPTSMTSGANVQFDAANGSVHQVVLKNKFGDIMSEFTENVSGTAMHGLTKPPQWQDESGTTRQFRAFIYVPSSPTINVGPAGQQRQRPVGDGVKLFIAVHELIHACGLSNSDHSPEGDPDLFIAQPQPAPGATPQGDKLRIRLQPLKNLPSDPPDPPLFLSARTAGLIQRIWS